MQQSELELRACCVQLGSVYLSWSGAWAGLKADDGRSLVTFHIISYPKKKFAIKLDFYKIGPIRLYSRPKDAKESLYNLVLTRSPYFKSHFYF